MKLKFGDQFNNQRNITMKTQIESTNYGSTANEFKKMDSPTFSENIFIPRNDIRTKGIHEYFVSEENNQSQMNNTQFSVSKRDNPKDFEKRRASSFGKLKRSLIASTDKQFKVSNRNQTGKPKLRKKRKKKPRSRIAQKVKKLTKIGFDENHLKLKTVDSVLKKYAYDKFKEESQFQLDLSNCFSKTRNPNRSCKKPTLVTGPNSFQNKAFPAIFNEKDRTRNLIDQQICYKKKSTKRLRMYRYKNATSMRDDKTGLGISLYQTGEVFFGEMSRNNRANGKGIFFFPFCGYVAGTFKDNKIEGKGLFKQPDTSFGVFEFTQGVMHGQAICFDLAKHSETDCEAGSLTIYSVY